MTRIILSDAGIYVTTVVVGPDNTPKYYSMRPGEVVSTVPVSPGLRTFDTSPGFVKPRWNGEDWEEAATAEEIKAWEAEHPAPVIPDAGPSLEDRVTALEEQTETWNTEAETAYQKGVQKA